MTSKHVYSWVFRLISLVDIYTQERRIFSEWMFTSSFHGLKEIVTYALMMWAHETKKKQPNPPTLWQLAMNKWEMQRRKEKIYPTTATQMLHISTGKIQLLCIMHTIKWVFSFVGHLVVWCCFFPSSSSRFAVRVVCMFCLVDFLLYIFFLLCTLHREFKWCVCICERGASGYMHNNTTSKYTTTHDGLSKAHCNAGCIVGNAELAVKAKYDTK